jgi:tRNA(Ile2) C34 agmatinyltransferase TiaS
MRLPPQDTVFYSAIKVKEKTRNCLRCGEHFLSKGPQNRMCYDCRRNIEGMDLKDYSINTPGTFKS